MPPLNRLAHCCKGGVDVGWALTRPQKTWDSLLTQYRKQDHTLEAQFPSNTVFKIINASTPLPDLCARDAAWGSTSPTCLQQCLTHNQRGSGIAATKASCMTRVNRCKNTNNAAQTLVMRYRPMTQGSAQSWRWCAGQHINHLKKTERGRCGRPVRIWSVTSPTQYASRWRPIPRCANGCTALRGRAASG